MYELCDKQRSKVHMFKQIWNIYVCLDSRPLKSTSAAKERKGKDVLLPYCKGVMLNPLPFHYRDGLGMGRESVLSRGAVTRSLGLLPPMVCVWDASSRTGLNTQNNLWSRMLIVFLKIKKKVWSSTGGGGGLFGSKMALKSLCMLTLKMQGMCAAGENF